MSKQTVFRLKAKNSADDLAASEEPIPSVEKYEVLIKVRGITLNYRDIAISKSQYPFAMKDDLVPGSDAAGDVVKVGEGVRDLKAGDRVIGCFDVTNQYGPQQDWNWGQGGPIDGVMRQYLTLPSSAVVKIPEGTPQSYLEWACLVCTGATAWNALFGNNPLIPGQTVLFQGKILAIL